MSLSAFMISEFRPDEGVQVHILNAAVGGLQVRADAPPKLGEIVEIKHRSLTIRGEVIRVEGKRFAIKSSEPIDLEQLLAKSNLATKIALTTHRSVGESPLHWSNQDRST